ncbi:MAG: hypothetical protein PSX81_16220 [bacterium]|nr:hypothetical protein [bacterium]
MKNAIFFLLLIFTFSSFKEKSKPSFKNVTVAIKYHGIRRMDTFFIKNARSPICIADFQNGESCLISGKDSVITCNVEDYTIVSVK